jgi:hypothetical protein
MRVVKMMFDCAASSRFVVLLAAVLAGYGTACSHVGCRLDPSVAKSLEDAKLGLVELGGYGSVRLAIFRGLVPQVRKLATTPRAFAIGVGRNSTGIIVSVDEVDEGAISEGLQEIALTGQVVSHLAYTGRSLGAIEAKFAPDGRQLAFVGTSAFPKRSGLHLLGADRHVLNLVSLDEGEFPSSVAWSPGSGEIVYDTSGCIYMISLASRTVRFLTLGTWPSMSPDGASIAYLAPDGFLRMIDRNGAPLSVAPLTSERVAGGVSWSPDGLFLLYTEARSGKVLVLSRDRRVKGVVLCPEDGWVGSRLQWIRLSSDRSF